MTRQKVNPKWQAERESEILRGVEIDETTSFLPGIQWLVVRLAKLGVPYKLYNLGAGVRRLTTETDTCPCCKHKVG